MRLGVVSRSFAHHRRYQENEIITALSDAEAVRLIGLGVAKLVP